MQVCILVTLFFYSLMITIKLSYISPSKQVGSNKRKSSNLSGHQSCLLPLIGRTFCKLVSRELIENSFFSLTVNFKSDDVSSFERLRNNKSKSSNHQNCFLCHSDRIRIFSIYRSTIFYLAKQALALCPPVVQQPPRIMVKSLITAINDIQHYNEADYTSVQQSPMQIKRGCRLYLYYSIAAPHSNYQY